MKLTTITEAAPFQARVDLDDGRVAYLRYRHGYAQLGIGADLDDAVIDPAHVHVREYGGPLDGSLTDDEATMLAAHLLVQRLHPASGEYVDEHRECYGDEPLTTYREVLDRTDSGVVFRCVVCHVDVTEQSCRLHRPTLPPPGMRQATCRTGAHVVWVVDCNTAEFDCSECWLEKGYAHHIVEPEYRTRHHVRATLRRGGAGPAAITIAGFSVDLTIEDARVLLSDLADALSTHAAGRPA